MINISNSSQLLFIYSINNDLFKGMFIFVKCSLLFAGLCFNAHYLFLTLTSTFTLFLYPEPA